jgi:hypothetical protein
MQRGLIIRGSGEAAAVGPQRLTGRQVRGIRDQEDRQVTTSPSTQAM